MRLEQSFVTWEECRSGTTVDGRLQSEIYEKCRAPRRKWTICARGGGWKSMRWNKGSPKSSEIRHSSYPKLEYKLGEKKRQGVKRNCFAFCNPFKSFFLSNFAASLWLLARVKSIEISAFVLSFRLRKQRSRILWYRGAFRLNENIIHPLVRVCHAMSTEMDEKRQTKGSNHLSHQIPPRVVLKIQ